MIQIQKHLLPLNPFSRPGRRMGAVRGIVMHWTGNAGQQPHGVKRYFELLSHQDERDEDPDRYASSHYVVGLSGEIVQIVPEEEVAYHAGAAATTEAAERFTRFPNGHLLGVEMCHGDWSGKFSPDTLSSARLLCADICRRYRLNPERDILRHFDISRKDCPKYWVYNPGEWELFLTSVTHELLRSAA